MVQHGRDVAIFGLGNMFEVGRGSGEETAGARHFGRADQSALDQADRHRNAEFFARSVEVICTIEDHVLHNGFGCAVMEHLHSNQINTPVVRIGWPDQFIEHGTIPVLRKKHGLTADALVKKSAALEA